MKKLTRNQWIGVAAGIVVIGIFYFTGASLLSFFGGASGQPANTSQGGDQMTDQSAQSAQSAQDNQNNSNQNMQPTDNATASSVTGLQITDQKVGTGAVATAGKTVSVKYVGAFTDGKVFDSSDAHGGQPFSFTLGVGQVIPGWDQGVVGMKVGGKRQLVIPPDLAYGANGVPGAIPPNSTLVFQVELLDVK